MPLGHHNFHLLPTFCKCWHIFLHAVAAHAPNGHVIHSCLVKCFARNSESRAEAEQRRGVTSEVVGEECESAKPAPAAPLFCWDGPLLAGIRGGVAGRRLGHSTRYSSKRYLYVGMFFFPLRKRSREQRSLLDPTSAGTQSPEWKRYVSNGAVPEPRWQPAVWRHPTIKDAFVAFGGFVSCTPANGSCL